MRLCRNSILNEKIHKDYKDLVILTKNLRSYKIEPEDQNSTSSTTQSVGSIPQNIHRNSNNTTTTTTNDSNNTNIDTTKKHQTLTPSFQPTSK